jgi:hypothetical protein
VRLHLPVDGVAVSPCCAPLPGHAPGRN